MRFPTYDALPLYFSLIFIFFYGFGPLPIRLMRHGMLRNSTHGSHMQSMQSSPLTSFQLTLIKNTRLWFQV